MAAADGRASSRGELAREAKPGVVSLRLGRDARPPGGAQTVGVVVPRAASVAPRCARGLLAGPAVAGEALAPAVLHPLPDVAGHVVQAEGVRSIAADRGGEGGAVVAGDQPGDG